MKNRKVALLTVLSVVIIAAGILGLSKLFENGWQNEEQISNTLNVDESNLYQEPINIDYPYYMLNDRDIYENSEFKQQYPQIIEMYERTKEKPNYMFDNSIASKTNFTHQDIANKCGEIIKYLYGRADLQNNKAAVLFGYFTEENENLLVRYWYKDEFEIFYNPISGAIEDLECLAKGTTIKEDNTDTAEWTQDYYTDDVKLDIEQMIYETVSIIKPEAEITNIKYSTDTNWLFQGVYHLRARIDYKDGKEAELCFRTRDFGIYELEYYIQKGFVW